MGGLGVQKKRPPPIRGPPPAMMLPPPNKKIKEYIMSIQENVARSMRRVRQERHISIELFADELGITKTSAQLYLKGEGNPRADTLELLAEGCGLSIAELVSGPPPGGERAETLLCAAQLLSGLPPDKREACVRHVLAIAAIFAGMQES